MPWLRDFMRGARPPITSLGKLAELALDHEQWPAHLRPKHRSLSTLFSKLDRGLDLDWLRDRIEVQQVLADLFARPISDIRTALGESSLQEDDRFVQLRDIRFARQLDLLKEPLPPGIPQEAWDPPQWQRTWWEAPSGSGRSLTAAWLRARGLAHTALIRERSDLARLPSRGPLFLEIDSSLSPETLELSRADLEQMRAFDRPLLFAASYPPPSLEFRPLESPPLEAYLPELVDWVNERLDESGTFAPARAESWMNKVAISARSVSTLGDALGLLGLLDEVSPRTLLAKSLGELAEYFVKRRIGEALAGSQLPPRLKDDAFLALQHCAARTLVDGKNNLGDALSIDEWTLLLSYNSGEETPDAAWFDSALKGSLGSQLSRRDLRRATQRLPPSSFQITRALEAAGLLRGIGSAQSRDPLGARRHLGPRWLVSLLSAHAEIFVLRLSPSSWGRVLLHGRSPGRIVENLISACHRGDFSAFYHLSDDFDEEFPEHVAALEGAITALGLAALEGIEPPDDVTEALLSLSAETLLVLQKMPEPRLTSDGPGAGLFQRKYFLVGLGALCRRIPFPYPHLDPVRSMSLAIVSHFTTTGLDVLGLKSQPTLRQAGLLDYIRSLHSSSREFSTKETTLPACLELLGSFATATQSLFEEALQQCSLEVIIIYLLKKGQSEHKIFTQTWRFLASRADPASFLDSSAEAKKLWQYLPGSILIERLDREDEVAWNYLLPHQYADFFASQNSPRLPPAGADSCPLDAALNFLQENGSLAFQDESLRIILSRAGARSMPHLLERIRLDEANEVHRLLTHTPPALGAHLARSLPEGKVLLGKSALVLNAIRAYLLLSIRERHPDFSECYKRLMEIEDGLGPLKRLG